MQCGNDWKGSQAMSVERHSDGRYRYRATGYYNDGTPCRISGTAPKTENTRAAALKKEADHLAWLATQAPPVDPQGGKHNNTPPVTATASTSEASAVTPAAPTEPPKPSAPTLTAFAPVYLASSRLENAFSSFESKEDILARYLVPRLGDLRLDQIDYAVIADLKVDLSQTRNARLKRAVKMIKPKTINNVLTVLGHVLQVGRKRGLIGSVPEITRVKGPPPTWDFLTFEESERLIAHAEGEWRTMIIVALRTGLRRGELLGLRWEDVDLANGRIHVRENYVRGRFKAPKNGKPREVPLSAQARQALEAHRHTRGVRVFCDAHGRPFTQGVMASQLERMCRLASLRTIGWHVARHSFASHLVMRGVPIRVVQELMGHASIVITQRYAHLAPHVSQDAVRLLDVPAATQPPATERPVSERAGKSRDLRGARRADDRSVAKNRQETRPEPLPN